MVSSANRMNFNILEEKHKSFTYIKNNNGPKMDPCGTPHVIRTGWDKVPLKETYCNQSVKYCLNHNNGKARIP